MPSATVGSAAPRVRDTSCRLEPLAPACVSSALTTSSGFDRDWFVACGRVHSSVDAGAGAGTDAIVGAPSFAAAPASVGIGIGSTGTIAKSACTGTSEAAEGASAAASAGAAPVSNACADPDDGDDGDKVDVGIAATVNSFANKARNTRMSSSTPGGSAADVGFSGVPCCTDALEIGRLLLAMASAVAVEATPIGAAAFAANVAADGTACEFLPADSDSSRGKGSRDDGAALPASDRIMCDDARSSSMSASTIKDWMASMRAVGERHAGRFDGCSHPKLAAVMTRRGASSS